MRLFELLLQPDVIDVNAIASKIRQDCKPFLTAIQYQVKKNLLWRGANSEYSATFEKCPINRQPRNTDIKYHRWMDDWFRKHTGIRYRSNALFVMHDEYQVDIFGPPNIVFPVGQFKFCWSPKFKDPYDEMFPEEGDWEDEDDNALTKESLEAILAKSYTTKNLLAAIKSKHEIMIHAPKGFYLLRPDYFEEGDFGKIIRLIEKPNS